VRVAQGVWQSPIPRRASRLAYNRFRFLNQEREIQTWNDPGIPPLWLYNLHYLDSPTEDLLKQWIAGNPIGDGTGWEPYPLSLRIPNWIKWQLAGNAMAPNMLASLGTQAEFLSKSIEHHLLGNHLLANAKAMLFAGIYFTGPESARWLEAGLEILNHELNEQILSDGAHFERSPMYHAIVLEDVLDVLNLAIAYPGAVAIPNRFAWSNYASQMLAWLSAISHPDGQISFFNDAAHGIAPDLTRLSGYAQRLGVQSATSSLGSSGYMRLENRSAFLLFDAAPLGPDYQPGHAHADTLSFELSLRDKRVVVNSGTSTYDTGPLRDEQRGTSAHNTATVDNYNSSEVWSAFRVARRAFPFDVRTDGLSFVEASHSGYHRLANPVTHRRRLELHDRYLGVIDSFEGRGHHCVKIYFHMHPDCAIIPFLDHKLTRSVLETDWCPEFNTAIPNRTFVGSWSGRTPVSFSTVIPFDPYVGRFDIRLIPVTCARSNFIEIAPRIPDLCDGKPAESCFNLTNEDSFSC
jgi:uncharacterized heparinase superfamily protein